MFYELYHRVSAMIDDLRECQEELCKIPTGKLREQGQKLVGRLQDLMNKLWGEPEEAQLVNAVPKFKAACTRVAIVLGRLQASVFSDMLGDDCNCPTCQAKRERAQPVVPIDRPAMPEPPLEIPGEALVSYLRQLCFWIEEAHEDLSIEEKLELPEIGDRYLIADVDQLTHVAECLKTGNNLRQRWEELTCEEGSRWDSTEIGVARISVIMSAVEVLMNVLEPPEETGCTIGKMIGRVIDESGLPPGAGGFLFGNFGSGPC